jgi:hypothetical protein
MRAVFADRSVRARLLRSSRASWLQRLSRCSSVTTKGKPAA